MRFAAVVIASISIAGQIAASAKTVEYNWTLKPRRASAKDPSLSPDCNLNRLMLLVNDQLPGPSIEADVGDTVKVNINNESPTESIALHFHGLHMKGQPYKDGSATVTQCASGPLQKQTYEFIVLDQGTHYWHGHTSMERTDGFQGPIIISDPDNDDEKQLRTKYDDDAVVFLQDWYHLDGQTRRTGLDTNPFIWIGNAQTFLINGGGVYAPCLGDDTDGLAAQLSAQCADNCSLDNYIKSIEVEAGKTYRLRIISGTELIGVNFAIHGHNMTVVEVEGAIIQPYEVENLDIMPAQRYSVLITANQEPGNYWATTSVRYRNTAPTGYLNIKYKDAPAANLTLDAAVPNHPAWDVTEPTIELEDNLLTKNPNSYDDYDILSTDPDSIRRIIAVGTQNMDNVLDLPRFAMNNVTMRMSKVPLITQAYDAVASDSENTWPGTILPGTVVVPDKPPNAWNYTEPVQDSVGVYNGDRGFSYIPLTENEVVEVVLQNALAFNGGAEMHSWHLHGNPFYVVGYGFGTFDEETDPKSYNLVNPVRRDTVSLLPLGWTAIRFKANNPGAWAFHCTQPAHAVMGMGFTFITSPDLIESPPAAARSCVENSLSPQAADDDEPSSSTMSTFEGVVAAASVLVGCSILLQ